MGSPRRFKKRPVEIEAMQWDGTAAGASPIINWILNHDGSANYTCLTDPCSGRSEDHTIAIETMEGRSLDLKPGGWVIRGIQGEFYPCAHLIFQATYEEI